MFNAIFTFELWYRLQRPATYIYFVLNILIGLLLGSIMMGALGPEMANVLGGGGQNYSNSPFTIHQMLIGFAQFPGTFFIAAMMAVPVYRDFRSEAHTLFFTKPVSKAAYLWGRFLGSFVMTLPIMIALGIGALMAQWVPVDNPPRLADFELWYYIKPYFVSIIPYTLFTSIIFFATVSLSRNQLFIYLNAILIFILFSIISTAVNEIDNALFASILDPTGSVAFLKDTEFWTVGEKNTLTAPLSLNWGVNLIIWQLIGLMLLFFVYKKFTLSYARVSLIKSQPKLIEKSTASGDVAALINVKLPKVSQIFSSSLNWRLLWMLVKEEMRRIYSSVIFWVMFASGILMATLTLVMATSTELFGTPTLPVTYQMIDLLVFGYLVFFTNILITFYAGESVWREKENKIKALFDIQPVPNWLFLTSKFLSLAIIPVVLMASGILLGVLVQLGNGFFEIDLGLYIQAMLGYRMINFMIYLILCLFIQVIVNNKFLGMGISFLILGFLTFMPSMLGIEDKLFLFMSATPLAYSDMNGYGHMLYPFMMFKLYWGALAVFLLMLAYGLYQRGIEYNLLTRFKLLSSNINLGQKITAGIALVLFFAMGGFIYYNTHVLNDFTSSKDEREIRVNYEKLYKRYEGKPQARITKAYIESDIYPEERDVYFRGNYTLVNKTQEALDTLHIIAGVGDFEYSKLEVDREHEKLIQDKEHAYNMYALKEALLPGDSLKMEFELAFVSKGFTNGIGNIQVLENGTFLNHFVLPSLGYNPLFELSDPSVRKKYDLPKRERRTPSIDDTVAVRNTLLSQDADWIDFEAIVSTSPDQIAMTPGYLQREWEENGRRYFHYKMDSKMVKFFNVVSGKYEVMKETWTAPDGRDISLEIYHHPSHTYNLDRMMNAMKVSLEYFSKEFSPYQHRQLRILEFPRYMSFAQSFANTVPFSEAIGFIADVDEGDVDYPTYVTAHEIGHQWWAHQVVGGNVQGFQFLSETMSQYAALMVMEQLSTPTEMREYLKHEMKNYLRGRSMESKEELPAHLSENQQYIHYNKGSVIMYALKDYIGEDSLNAAMRRYIEAVKFQEPPYTTTKEWMKYVQAVTPDSLKYVLTDLFETITLYDNKCVEASYAEIDERYKVNFKVASKKLRDDGRGFESEVAINDYIDIGITGRHKVDGKWKDTILYLEKHKITQDSTDFELWVDLEPREVGIDPLNKLIDRSPDDNTKRPKKVKDETKKEESVAMSIQN